MPLPLATEPKLTLVGPVMVPLLTKSAPLRSRELPKTFKLPPGLMVMREPPPETRLLTVLSSDALLLMLITPSLEKAVVASDAELRVMLPLETLMPPSHDKAAELVRLPPLVKLTKLVAPVG